MTFARRLTPAVLFDPRALAEHQRVQEEFRKALSEPRRRTGNASCARSTQTAAPAR
jgi:hypothetical protein